VRAVRRPMAQYFGPFRGRAVPASVVRLAEKLFMLRSCAGSLRPDPSASPCLQHGVGLCTAPCARKVDLNGYRQQVRNATRALSDADFTRILRSRLVQRREMRADALDFEAAADDQRRIDWLDELDSYRGVIEGPDVRRSWLVVLPHAERGRRVLVPVARGRVLRRMELCWANRDWPRTIESVCYRVRLEELRAESVFPPAELVPSLIVSGWLESGAPGGLALDLDRNDTGDVLAALSPLAPDEPAARPATPAGEC
jgi:excinuclease UvrABC nuclease subunit